ncbi:TetR/AcrR family transcriptional regulator [Methylocella sp.]|uniref:TetR/AcrR family transcriptional regulator n=1 Tax=Methylocella sp. TaxID=1978226 RepID=UPI0035ADF46D
MSQITDPIDGGDPIHAVEPQTRKIPRGDRRRDQIAIVAEAAFLERGYAETTMAAIAALAEASKETLYRHFGTKAELFAEVVRRRCARYLNADDALRGPPREALAGLAVEFVEFLGRPDSLRLYRLVVAESAREPELGRIFFDQGPGRLVARLADYLREAARRGELDCPDPHGSAWLFLGALISYPQASALLLGAPLPGGEPRRHARAAVEMFLAGHGAPRDG